MIKKEIELDKEDLQDLQDLKEVNLQNGINLPYP